MHIVMSRTGVVVVVVVLAMVTMMACSVHGNELDDMLYDDLASKPCVRLMTATGSVGCATPYGGKRTSGLLFLVDSTTRAQQFRDLGDDHDRTVLLTPAMFTHSMVQQLSTSYLAGIVLLPSPRPAALSPASSRPQGEDGLSPTYQWNPPGSGMLGTHYDFPIVAVDAAEATLLLVKAQENHDNGVGSFPQHAVDFLFDMGPSDLTSLKCLRDNQCLPLGGHSVWGTIGTLDTSKKMVMLASNLDSNAMFHELAVGASGTASDIVAVLAAVQALAHVGVSSLKHQIGFGLFQAEAWGRLGSRRFVAEVESFTCSSTQSASTSVTGFAFCKSPVRTDLSFEQLSGDSFAHVIAIDQAGAGSGSTYLHKLASSTLDAAVANAAVAGAGSSGLAVAASTVSDVPPSPLTSFTQQWSGVDGAVLTTYDTVYSNQFYHSSLDNSDRANAARTAQFATTIARTLYAAAAGWNTTAAAGGVPADLVADTSLVEKLLTCMTADADCPTFASILGTTQSRMARFAGTGALSLYTGVNHASRAVVSSTGQGGFVVQPSVMELLARTFLNNVSATDRRGSCTSTSACKDIDTKLECQAGTCVVPVAHYHEALSSALQSASGGGYLLFEDKLQEPGADPLWTEPYWSNDIGIRLYLAGNPATDVWTLVVGILVILASIGIVIHISRVLQRQRKLV